MTENFNSMYWIKKRVEHEDLAQAIRAAERRKQHADAQRVRRKQRANRQPPKENHDQS